MNKINSFFQTGTKKLNKYYLIQLLLWTILVVILYINDIIRIKNEVDKLSMHTAQTILENDWQIRNWALHHQGAYNKKDSITESASFMISNSKKKETSQHLNNSILIDPISIQDEIYAYSKEKGMHEQIISLSTLKTKNNPDKWEENALIEFKEGLKEKSRISELEGKSYLKLIKPIFTNEYCTICNTKHTLNKDEEIYGLSISIPLEPYLLNAKMEKKRSIINFGILWLFGFISSFVAFMIIKKQRNKQKQVENKAQESEQKFQSFFKSNQAVMLQIDVETKKIINANKAACKFYNYSLDELLTKSIVDLHTLSMEEISDRMKQAAKNESNYFEFKHRISSTEIRDVEVYASPILINNKMNIFIIVHDITDKKIAFDLLKNNEQRLKKLANLTFEGILIHNEGIVLDSNKSFLKMFGFTSHEIIGKNIIDIIIPEKYKEIINNKMQEDYADPYHLEMRKKNGEMFPVEIEAHKIFYENKPARVAAIRDITNIQKAEADVLKSNQKLSLHIEQTPLAVIEWDLNFKVLSWNKSAERIFGYSAKEALGKHASFIVPIIYKSNVDKVWEELLENKESSQNDNQNIAKDGSIIYCSWYNTPLINHLGEIIGVTSLVMDITRQRLAEKEMKKLSTAVNQSPTTIVITDINGNIEYVNPQFTLLTGYSFEEALGKNPRILKSEKTPQETFDELWKTITNGKIWQGELTNKKKDGSEFIEKTIIAPIKDENDRIINFMAIKEDITRQKEAESNLINKTIELEEAEEKLQAFNEELITTNQALEDNMNALLDAKEKAEEGNRLKSAFLANMSHEVRTPMNGIVGFIQLLKNPELDYRKRLNFMDIIEKSGNQLLSIINDIVDISKIEAGQIQLHKKEIKLSTMLEELYDRYKPIADEKNLTLLLKKQKISSNFKIINDESRLYQVLQNLLNNALKFTQKGKIEFGYKQKNNLVEFFVSDTGIGIKPEDQEKIFERFRQLELTTKRQYGGTGLGLAISKSIINLIGERIWVESEYEIGSTFFFTIKCSTREQLLKTPEEVNYEEKERNWRTKNILIAEDEESNFLYLKEVLEETNVNLTRVRNGLEAVRILDKQAFDLILMDIKMPIMDGKEATIKIKQKYPEIPIIAQTAFAMENDKEEILKNGFNDYISKPISIKELLCKIETLLIPTYEN